MKLSLKPTAVLAALLIFSLSAEAAETPAAQLLAPAAKVVALPPAPSVVSARTPLSREELARYQQKDAKCRTTRAAGADDARSWWIIGGAVVGVGLTILIAGGSHSNGGGGY
jgi:hypothetical protein